MLATAPGCKFDVKRGPDWLFVRVKNFDPNEPDSPPLAERIWTFLQQHFTYRVVLELDEVPMLNSAWIDELLVLYQRIHECDGMMRLCGLSPYNLRLLHACRLDERLTPFRDCQEAVMGRPRQPHRQAQLHRQT